jgi:hypothetical protein
MREKKGEKWEGEGAISFKEDLLPQAISIRPIV